jgi:N-acetylglucosaminyldiphosphoundecaprenol N-acetyl-beta-D-mannosaminyltransferase
MRIERTVVSHEGGTVRELLDPDIAKPSEVIALCEVMGLRLHDLHPADIARQVVNAASARRRMLVLNANALLVTLAQSEPWIPRFFNRADIAFCDGAGAQLAVLLLTGRKIHRSTPPDWIVPVLEKLGPEAKIFWVGGRPDVVLEAAENYKKRYNVQTVGVQHGYFDMAPDSPESLELIERINQAAPNIVLVNMGMPRQEKWLSDNWHRLTDCVAISGGALVDHAAGRVSRPSRWVSTLGLEWSTRLVREPRRLWRRYLLGLPIFGFHILRHAIKARTRSMTGRSLG